MVAEAAGKLVGAAWARIMEDYGHVDDDTPSLAAAVEAPYRGRGSAGRCSGPCWTNLPRPDTGVPPFPYKRKTQPWPYIGGWTSTP